MVLHRPLLEVVLEFLHEGPALLLQALQLPLLALHDPLTLNFHSMSFSRHSSSAALSRSSRPSLMFCPMKTISCWGLPHGSQKS